MAENVISLASHEAKIAEIRAQLDASKRSESDLTTKLESAGQRAKDLQVELTAAETKLAQALSDVQSLKVQKDAAEAQAKLSRGQAERAELAVGELKSKLAESESKLLGIEVKETILAAVDPGKPNALPPAVFDGWEANPGQWMTANYASLGAFKDAVSRMRGVSAKLGSSLATAKATASGSDPNAGDPEAGKDEKEVALSADEKKVLDRFGGSTFVGVTTAAEARERMKAAQKK